MSTPSRKHTLLFALLMSCYTAFLMSAILTAVNTGLDAGFVGCWRGAAPSRWC